LRQHFNSLACDKHIAILSREINMPLLFIHPISKGDLKEVN